MALLGSLQHRILIKNSWSPFPLSRSPSFCFELFSLGIPSPKKIKSIAQKVLKKQSRLDGFFALGFAFELSILLCSDKEIAILNKNYRAKEEATDVLAFPLIQFPQKAVSSRKRSPAKILREGLSPLAYWNQKTKKQESFLALGDLVISCPSCIRQAKKNKNEQDKGSQESNFKAVQSEFIRLLIHGILHLFGYDHEAKKQDEIRMQKREKLLYKHVLGSFQTRE